MTQLLTTLRHQDLIHSQAEVARQTERIAGVSELPPTQIQPWGWGFLLTGLDASKQPWRWLDTERIVRRYLADTVEVGEFGVDAVVSHAIAGIPAGRYVGICHWLNRSTALEHIRQRSLGPIVEQRYGSSSLRVHAASIALEFSIKESEPNDAQLPAYSRVKWGWLFRLPAKTAVEILNYLVASPTISTELVATALGANCFANLAFPATPEESLRIGISNHWNQDLTINDLGRWLKSLRKERRSS